MLEMIVAALVAGAASKDVAEDAIKSAYGKLKDALTSRFGKTSTGVQAVAEDPQDEPAQALAKAQLSKSGADKDADIIKLAQQLTDVLKVHGQLPTMSNTSTHNSGISIQGSSVGGNVIQGDQNNYAAGAAPDMSSIVTDDGRKLVPLLNGYFNISEIDNLCFEMGIDDENLRGQTKEEKARSLVKFVEQNGRIPELKKLMRVARPNLRGQLS